MWSCYLIIITKHCDIVEMSHGSRKAGFQTSEERWSLGRRIWTLGDEHGAEMRKLKRSRWEGKEGGQCHQGDCPACSPGSPDLEDTDNRWKDGSSQEWIPRRAQPCPVWAAIKPRAEIYGEFWAQQKGQEQWQGCTVLWSKGRGFGGEHEGLVPAPFSILLFLWSTRPAHGTEVESRGRSEDQSDGVRVRG